MVAVLLSLRFQVLANTLRRNTFQLVAVIVGGVLTVGLVLFTLAGWTLAGFLPPPVTQAIVVVGGSTLVLGWLIVPLLFDGVDRTVDPTRLARFGIPVNTLMIARFVVGIAWVPGAATLVVALGTVLAWRAHPAAAAAALAAGLVGTATCVAMSQLSTAVVGSILTGRRSARVAIGALGALLVVVPVVLIAADGSATTRGVALPGLAAAFDVAGWSPFGAVWSIPGRVAQGDAAGAAIAAVVAAATLVGALLLWRATLVAHGRRGGTGKARAPGARGAATLRWLPAGPVGAIATRSLIYWFRDGRQARQLVLLPLLPALMIIWWRLFDVEAIALAIGPLTAVILPLSAFATVSYDGTAFAAELAAGTRGVHDRLGRAVALLTIALPATIIVQVAVAVVTGRTDTLPALLGLSIAGLLVAAGVVGVSSARIVVPVPRAGRNPFAAQAGAATTAIFASYAVAAATIVLALPAAAVSIAAVVLASPVLGWVALVVGIAVGLAVLTGGVLLGGRILDATAPELLARLHAVRV